MRGSSGNRRKVLLLTTEPPNAIKTEWPHYQNYNLPDILKARGALVTLKSWREEGILTTISQFDTVTFLWCKDYYKHSDAFFNFLDELQKTAYSSSCAPKMINDINLIQWNTNKRYLLEMEQEGFAIPETRLVQPEKYTVSGLHALVQDFFPSGSVVLKPSISGSAIMTHRVTDTSTMSLDDLTFLKLCTQGKLHGFLVIQAFEPNISAGEYSFIFVCTSLTHVMLKRPKEGDYRVQDIYGGFNKLLDIRSINADTLQVVQEIFMSLQRRFGEGRVGYVRIDGLITNDRPFVLMEIEAIEPHLWLETGNGVDEMLNILEA
ncbi:ATP-grasp domain-containing protein [Aspergillus tanneri]|uniref:ATP-grasp domain-containing protein n=1 Tax=Aspergillus tanneri TaxID=1220188 RepID=A0A5M9N4M8_9EURO|nr:uncharacterized protein ATNIH1004_002198 [Aspergillus tanneri]KAA8649527.1 hypothetical protein ATNIH1004_002198 [Aspergillus tanneri]